MGKSLDKRKHMAIRLRVKTDIKETVFKYLYILSVFHYLASN